MIMLILLAVVGLILLVVGALMRIRAVYVIGGVLLVLALVLFLLGYFGVVAGLT